MPILQAFWQRKVFKKMEELKRLACPQLTRFDAIKQIPGTVRITKDEHETKPAIIPNAMNKKERRRAEPNKKSQSVTPPSEKKN